MYKEEPKFELTQERRKEEYIQKILNAKSFDEFYDIYSDLIPKGGIELKDIDKRLIEKEKELFRNIHKEDCVYYGRDVYKQYK